MLSKFNYLGIKKVNTQYDVSKKLKENSYRSVSQLDYASVIGRLVYDMHCTRPDIAYVVCKLSRYTYNPSSDHWKVISRVLGYLKRIRSFSLFYDKFPSILQEYCDASG